MEIPASVEEIGSEAFYGCERLTKITIVPNSRLTKIGNRCFSNSGLKAFVLPAVLKALGDDAFDKCKSLETVVVDDNCEISLLRAKIPDTVFVGPSAVDSLVKNLRNLKEVVVPEGTKKIGNHWFYGSEIESVEVPASSTEIGTQAFYGCGKLKRILFTEDS